MDEQESKAPAEVVPHHASEGSAAHGQEAPPDDLPSLTPDELLAGQAPPTEGPPMEDAQLRALLEAIVYVTEEPVTPQQAAAALGLPKDRVEAMLDLLAAEYDKPEHGVAVREVAGGYKMATKAEHHEGVRAFAKSLKPPLKLSLAALETLAVVAYKQPVTAPEIMEIRGVQGAGVLKTLLDRKLIAVAGRKNVIGKPVLYKTTKEFLLQFGLSDIGELPTLKEFEELRRLAIPEDSAPAEAAPPPSQAGDTAQAGTSEAGAGGGQSEAAAAEAGTSGDQT
jgi:segregation and condensation protein B